MEQTVATHVMENLTAGRVMQLASVREGKPWIATVYFVADEVGRVYWLSYPTRRHSEDVAADAAAAVAIAVKTDQPVIGLQASGTVRVVADAETVRRVLPGYVAKYGNGADFITRFEQGTAEHRLYEFTPEEWWLFDEVHFPGGQRQAAQLPLLNR
jgi:uncharacterized protein YhbP (UPF0306 family)